MMLVAIRRAAIAVACTTLSGCVGLVLSSLGEEQRAAWFLVPADKAVIYFYRDEANDDVLPLALSVDGNLVAETRPAKFLFYEVTPGPHTVASPGAISDSVELNTEAGKTYFIGQEVGCEATQLRLRLHTVDQAMGKARVRALYAAGKNPMQDGAPVAPNVVACPPAMEGTGATRL
jgi:hypothetical protein